MRTEPPDRCHRARTNPDLGRAAAAEHRSRHPSLDSASPACQKPEIVVFALLHWPNVAFKFCAHGTDDRDSGSRLGGGESSLPLRWSLTSRVT